MNQQELKALLDDWLKFASDVIPGDMAGMDSLEFLRHRTEAWNQRSPSLDQEAAIIEAALVMCECMPERQEDFDHLRQVILESAKRIQSRAALAPPSQEG